MYQFESSASLLPICAVCKGRGEKGKKKQVKELDTAFITAVISSNVDSLSCILRASYLHSIDVASRVRFLSSNHSSMNM